MFLINLVQLCNVELVDFDNLNVQRTYFLLSKIDFIHLNVQTSALKQENSEFFALISHDLHLYACQSLDIKIYQKKIRL